jgi:DNA-binding NarL/FixJ family response regulator
VPLINAISELALRANLALEDQVPPSNPPPAIKATPPRLTTLTERELAVLRQVGAGKTNAEIGAALFMSPKTASVHVTNILRKLEIRSRVQAAAIAGELGMLDDAAD